MNQFNKEELNNIVCQSSSDYEILNNAYKYINEIEKKLKKSNKKIKDIKKELGQCDEISSLERLIEMILGE